jgi:hypothetical protein
MKTHRLLNPARGGLLASLALCLWLWQPAGATAGLTYDLRVNGGKVAYVTTVGQVITLDLYAQVTGAAGNGAAEGFQDGFGSVLSSAGGNITGSLSSSFVAPFSAPGAQAGMQQTLDADSDLDLGSNSTVHSSEFFFARAGSMQTTGGTAITDGTEFKIASFSFTVQTVGSFADFSPISINFRVPLFSNNLDIEALWQQDGSPMTSNGLNGGTQPAVGDAVLVSVPEPSATWLLAAAAGLMAARRRPPTRRA